VEALAAAGDAAADYAVDGDTLRRLARWPVRAIAAGGLNTSIRSLANWLRFHLDQGEFEGQRMLPPSMIRELQTPRAYVGTNEFSEYSDGHYGFGFRVRSYRGERMVWHGGGWAGTFALQAMLPDHGVGVAVLANSNTAPEILVNYVFDRMCGKEPVPWFDRLRERRRFFLAQLAAQQHASTVTSPSITPPSHGLADYAGDYEHPGYGRVTIAHAAGELTWTYRGMSERLSHREQDTFELPDAPKSPGDLLPGRLSVAFAFDRDGQVAGVAIPFEPMVSPIVFSRVAA